MTNRRESRHRKVSDEQAIKARVEHRVSRTASSSEVAAVRGLVDECARDAGDRRLLYAMLGLDE